MQLKWLEDFIALAETQSFSKSAVFRHVTHPAFGRRIRSLELWCGVDLIDRTGYPVKLTEQGVAFFELARDTLRNLQEFKELAVGNGRDIDGRFHESGFAPALQDHGYQLVNRLPFSEHPR
jgi:DNA-binding transcriptional LysR family regulator